MAWRVRFCFVLQTRLNESQYAHGVKHLRPIPFFELQQQSCMTIFFSMVDSLVA